MKVLKSLFKKNRNKQKRKLSNWIMVKAKETKLKKRTKVAVDHCLLFLFLDFQYDEMLLGWSAREINFIEILYF